MKRIVPFFVITLVFTAGAQAQQDGVFRQEGIASWYGSEFDGMPTASGEIFNSQDFTAAHPTLPFGTTVRVTNRHNNRQVVVRVNDRGPFVAARIIDVSRAAAEALDMIVTGTAPVLVEAVGASYPAPAPAPSASPGADWAAQPPQQAAPAPAYTPAPLPQTAPAPAYAPSPQAQAQRSPGAEALQNGVWAEPLSSPAPAPPNSGITLEPAPRAAVSPYIPPPAEIKGTIVSGKTYRVQVGAYKIPRYAVDAFDRLKQQGLTPAYEKSGDFYKVVISGVFPEEIPIIAQKLGAAGFKEALAREER